jgi:hypothetical protein
MSDTLPAGPGGWGCVVTLFISYSSRDKDGVKNLTQDLQDAEEQVWMDQRLAGGQAWWRAILEQIRGCEVFIFALSQNSAQSKPCQAELHYAQALGLPILPVQVGAVKSMQLSPMATVQTIDYRTPTTGTAMRLFSTLNERKTQRLPLPSPLPDEPEVPFEYLMRLYTTVAGSGQISPRDQASLVAQLQVGLQEDGEHDGARNDIVSLLNQLHDRPDANHKTRSDVEAILASIDSQYVAPEPTRADDPGLMTPAPAAQEQPADVNLAATRPSPPVSPPHQGAPPRVLDYFRVGPFEQSVLTVEEHEFYCVEFSRDQTVIAAGSGDAAMIWRLPAAKGLEPAYTLPHPRFVYSLCFTPDGKTLVTGCEDGGVRFWDWCTDKNEEDLEAHNGTEYAHKGAVYAVAISGDGTYLATGGYDGVVHLWTGQIQLEEHRFGAPVSSIAFPREGSMLAVGTHDNKIYLWDTNPSEPRELGHHDSSVESVAFSPDGSQVASCGLDKRVKLWDVDSGREKPSWRGVGHNYLVKSVAFSPDGRTIASAGWDKTVRLWDVAGKKSTQKISSDKLKIWSEKLREPLEWHTDWIWDATFSPYGDILASAGSDGQLILWPIPGQTVG